MSRYRVLNIITRLEQGGAPLALLETVKRMDRGTFDVTVVAGLTEDEDRNLDMSGLAFDLPLIMVPALRRSVHPIRDVVALYRLIQIIRAGKYDVVHTHTSKAGVLGRIAAAICNVPAIVHSSHGTILHGYFSPFVTRIFAYLEKFAASMSHRIICLTHQEIGQYLKAGIGRKSQYTYIFNGIDISAFEHRRGDRSRLRKEMAFEDEDIVCVSVGRLVPVKGQSDLLHAFGLAHSRSPKLKLIIIGDGELRPQLEQQIRDLGIQDATRLVGWREDVAELLDACDLFVLTSHNEGLGLVLVEAMAKGLPVVATAVGGVPEVVQDGQTGSLVPSGDPKAIASAIIRLSADAETRASMGRRGYARATEFFSIDQTVRNTEDLYTNLLSTRL